MLLFYQTSHQKETLFANKLTVFLIFFEVFFKENAMLCGVIYLNIKHGRFLELLST
ncbi:hypothetical protein DMC16_02065 [Lacticaseibacillus paracasei]|nr:hypothetical protein DMC16_02065 [Lacticaseibacillus paracasei]